jgi:hypothetical protein
MNFRKATEQDVPIIVQMIANDDLGEITKFLSQKNILKPLQLLMLIQTKN